MGATPIAATNQMNIRKWNGRISTFFGVVVFCNVIWFGCVSLDKINIAPKKLDNNIQINFKELHQLIIDSNIGYVQGSSIADAYYAIPSLDWYKSTYHKSVQFRVGAKLAYGESGDCDDYTYIAKAVASELNWENGTASLPVGFFGYEQDSGSNHALIIFAYEENGKAKLGFYEPQHGGRFLNLTKKEIESCIFWYF